MRSIRRAELALLVVAVWLCGCPALPDRPRYLGAGNQTPQRGGTLMIWEEARVRMLDPHIAFDQISAVVITMLYDSLYSYDYDMKLTPAIAAALPNISEDGRTLIVPLRHGVRFHNGRELTADDVVWSFERMLGPDLHSPGAPYYSAIVGLADYQAKKSPHVAGLSATDRYTLRIELEKPDQSFAFTLAMRFASPMPREFVEKPGVDLRRQALGTGPFKLVTWDPGVRLVFERNAQYYVPELPHVDRVVFEEGLKKDTALMRFRNGEVDIAPRLSPADTMLMKTPPWKPYTAQSSQADIFGIFMNTQLAPFDDVHVRRAVAMAIDRERWARARNYAIRPAGQILPPKVMGHDPALAHVQHFDLALARREMKLAGHADGLREPVTLWTTEGNAARQYGELFQADMAKIGISVELKPVSFPVYLEETGKPKTAQMVAGGWSMDFPDPSNLFNLVSKSGIAEQDSMNRSFYSDPKLDALLDRAIVERDVPKRTAMYREANDMVADAAPWAFHSNTQALQAWQPYVKGYAPHPTEWLYVHEVWLDLPKKRVAQRAAQRDVRLALLSPLSVFAWEARR